MKRVHALFPSVAALAWLAFAGAARAQPAIELPPEQPKPALPRPAIDLPRETQIEVPLDAPAMSGTSIGGYGEIVLNAPVDSPNGGDHATVDVRRLVLYLGHNFNERLRLYSELEIEHAVSSASDQGEIEVEQVFLDYLVKRWLNLRGGLVIMPVGIINVYHEPPTFNGADRPETDTRIIPSTWREVGAGFFGAIGPVRYQAYAVTGFDAKGFNDEGLAGGHQEGQFARAHDWGLVARADWIPWAPLDVGFSVYWADSGQGEVIANNALPGVPVTLLEGDLRFAWKGIGVRAEFANVWIGDAGVLDSALSATATATATGQSGFSPVASQLRGGYVEAGYNVLQKVKTKYNSSLVAFGRYERTNTQAQMPSGVTPVAGKDRQLVTLGLTLRPIAEVAVKVDYQRIWTDAGTGWNQVNAGLGFMY